MIFPTQIDGLPTPNPFIYVISRHIARALFFCNLLVVVGLCSYYQSIRDSAATPRQLPMLLQLYCRTIVDAVVVHHAARSKNIGKMMRTMGKLIALCTYVLLRLFASTRTT